MNRLLAVALLLLAIPLVFHQIGFAQTDAGNKAAEAQSAITRLLGKSVEIATEHKSNTFVGDFNGDTFGDLLVLTKLKTARSGLPKNVKVLNPWGYESKDSSGTSGLALVIVHGTSAGWDTPNSTGAYVLTDRDFFSTPIWEAKQDALISVARKATRRGKRLSSGKTATGDTINLATEAGIDVTLYWDGKTYRLDTPQEEP
ncbi:MAG TPA: hypothetical protein VM866_07590 [Pyrinomonadaceae bacterium]|jgi:hypothetical protein|nr:hypothetical protein [Pyrinomonadaceae bacterium]